MKKYWFEIILAGAIIAIAIVGVRAVSIAIENEEQAKRMEYEQGVRAKSLGLPVVASPDTVWGRRGWMDEHERQGETMDGQ